ncbi:MAG TPA: hypothetical protein VFD05_01115 [Bacilli bacterium]|nr:hypothetical protein [Bacilli bacterium]
MQRRTIDLLITALVTSGLFVLFTFLNLEHTFAFLTPVMLAVFIMRYEVKGAIIPALIIFVIGVVAGILIKGELWYHGLIFIVGGITVGFLHGGLSKKLSHLKELSFVVLFDVLFGLVTALVFYMLNDPIYAINLEFGHYLNTFSNIINLNETTNFAQNFSYVFQLSFAEYIVTFGIIEATLTHIFIHLVLKFIYKGTEGYTFSDLNYTLPKFVALPFAALLVLTLSIPFLMMLELSKTILIIFIVISTITLSAILLFVHQGVVVLSLYFNRKVNFNLAPFIYVLGIILFVPFAVLGVVDSFLNLQQKLLAREDVAQHNYFKVIH